MKVIRAGNDNLFQSEIFANTIATLISHQIEIYNTTGAIGAARAVGLHEGNFEKFGSTIMGNDLVKTYTPVRDKKEYINAYEKWKKELEILINT